MQHCCYLCNNAALLHLLHAISATTATLQRLHATCNKCDIALSSLPPPIIIIAFDIIMWMLCGVTMAAIMTRTVALIIEGQQRRRVVAIATPQGHRHQAHYRCCFLLMHGQVQDRGWRRYTYPAPPSRTTQMPPPPQPGTEAKGCYALVWFGIQCDHVTDPESLIAAGGITTMTARPIRSQQ
jgi:hypothetical protein